MANPNPASITSELWNFWEAFAALEPTVQLGGIYAAKPGYHNTRAGNASTDYSVRDPQDQLGPPDKAAAIDLTFPNAQAGDYTTIARYSRRLLDSGRDPDDDRGNFIREFFGNADDDAEVEGWDFRYIQPATSDTTHLWHIHISISREHVANPAAYRALLSILRGQTVAQWRAADPAPSTEEDTMRGILLQDNTGVALLYPHPLTGELVWTNAVSMEAVAGWQQAGWPLVGVDTIYRHGKHVVDVAAEVLTALRAGGSAGTAGLTRAELVDAVVEGANQAEDR
jgi:hypothetical protein